MCNHPKTFTVDYSGWFLGTTESTKELRPEGNWGYPCSIFLFKAGKTDFRPGCSDLFLVFKTSKDGDCTSLCKCFITLIRIFFFLIHSVRTDPISGYYCCLFPSHFPSLYHCGNPNTISSTLTFIVGVGAAVQPPKLSLLQADQALLLLPLLKGQELQPSPSQSHP